MPKKHIAAVAAIILVFALCASAAADNAGVLAGFEGHIQKGIDLSVFDDARYSCVFYDVNYTAQITENSSGTLKLRLFISYDTKANKLVFYPGVNITPWDFYQDGFYVKIGGNRYYFDAPQRNNHYLSKKGLEVFEEMANAPDGTECGQRSFSTSLENYAVFDEAALQGIRDFFTDCRKAGISFSFNSLGLEPVVITHFN